jgi:hypothetical protein
LFQANCLKKQKSYDAANFADSSSEIIHTSVGDLDLVGSGNFDWIRIRPLKMLSAGTNQKRSFFSHQHFQNLAFSANHEKTSEILVISI